MRIFNPPASTAPSGAAGGDLSGTYPNPTVASIGGKALTLGSAANLFQVNAQTGTTYTLAASDNGKLVTFSNVAAITVTLPQQSDIPLPTGFMCYFLNLGTGTVTFTKEGAETQTGNTTAITSVGGIIERNSTTNWNIFGGTATVNLAGIDFLIQTVANNTYVLMGYVGTPMTVLGVYEKARALTTAGTFSMNINGTGITSLTAVVPSTAGHYVTATGLNTCVRGDQITIVYSGTSLVLDHNITIDATVQY